MEKETKEKIFETAYYIITIIIDTVAFVSLAGLIYYFGVGNTHSMIFCGIITIISKLLIVSERLINKIK